MELISAVLPCHWVAYVHIVSSMVDWGSTGTVIVWSYYWEQYSRSKNYRNIPVCLFNLDLAVSKLEEDGKVMILYVAAFKKE
jgi:hypothetical protein